MKNILRMAMLLLPMLGLLSSCSSDEDIVFDHEKAAFDIQADKVLLEVITPSNTAADEDIYIVGAFNGLDDESVIGNEKWKLTQSQIIQKKRGIYLDPTEFVEGKTLQDGFHFVSSKQRNEVSLLAVCRVRLRISKSRLRRFKSSRKNFIPSFLIIHTHPMRKCGLIVTVIIG